MAPFRRGRSSNPPPVSGGGEDGGGAPDYDDDENNVHNGAGTTTIDNNNNGRRSAWEARRRRKAKNGSSPSANGGVDGTSPAPTRSTSSRRNGKKNEPFPDDEYDPYDSDPGESYREHCERIKGERTRSCLAMPRFLKDNLNKLDRKVANAANGSSRDPSVSTSPPSPLQSELDDDGNPLSPHGMFHHPGSGGLPASLPRDLARVRYSLRTSIGDGTDVQAALGSASLMERRELRPNNIHINVSHWSDFGGRNYMEDR